MADKIDQLKIGNTSYDIDLPPDATPSVASLTVDGQTFKTIDEDIYLFNNNGNPNIENGIYFCTKSIYIYSDSNYSAKGSNFDELSLSLTNYLILTMRYSIITIHSFTTDSNNTVANLDNGSKVVVVRALSQITKSITEIWVAVRYGETSPFCCQSDNLSYLVRADKHEGIYPAYFVGSTSGTGVSGDHSGNISVKINKNIYAVQNGTLVAPRFDTQSIGCRRLMPGQTNIYEYYAGSAGQVLMSDGANIYWGNVATTGGNSFNGNQTINGADFLTVLPGTTATYDSVLTLKSNLLPPSISFHGLDPNDNTTTTFYGRIGVQSDGKLHINDVNDEHVVAMDDVDNNFTAGQTILTPDEGVLGYRVDYDGVEKAYLYASSEGGGLSLNNPTGTRRFEIDYHGTDSSNNTNNAVRFILFDTSGSEETVLGFPLLIDANGKFRINRTSGVEPLRITTNAAEGRCMAGFCNSNGLLGLLGVNSSNKPVFQGTNNDVYELAYNFTRTNFYPIFDIIYTDAGTSQKVYGTISYDRIGYKLGKLSITWGCDSGGSCWYISKISTINSLISNAGWGFQIKQPTSDKWGDCFVSDASHGSLGYAAGAIIQSSNGWIKVGRYHQSSGSWGQHNMSTWPNGTAVFIVEEV